MDFVTNAVEDIGIVGQFFLLYLLSRAPFRRYYLIFVYVLAELLATAADKYAIESAGRQSPLFRNVYYGTDLFVDLLLFVVVIVFTYQIMEDSPLRDKVRKVLAAIALGAIVVPFVLFSSSLFSRAWYNSTIQLFNFGAAIMNLGMWTAVIARKTRDRQLMLVCAGLGIAVAGNAALWGMRKFTTGEAQIAANLLIQIMYLVKLGIWIWAFRPQRTSPVAPVDAKSYAG
jgi:hypothetical protein